MAESGIETLKEMRLTTDLREGAEIVAPVYCHVKLGGRVVSRYIGTQGTACRKGRISGTQKSPVDSGRKRFSQSDGRVGNFTP